MQIEQIYTGCLAQGAYYITSNGEAAIIDPLRETKPYLDRLQRDGVKLKYIFETHFHADFVSGHVDLSKETGAPIVYGPNATCEFDCVSATDGQEFVIGNIKIKKMKATINSDKNNSNLSWSKKILLTFVFVFVSSPFFAQAFDKFDGQDDVTSIIVNKKMFELMSKVKVDASDKETQQYLSLIKKLDNLKVFTTKSTRVEGEMRVAADKYIKSAGLEELMRVNENGRNVKILVKSGTTDSQIRELLMFIEGAKNDDTVLMSLTGIVSDLEISSNISDSQLTLHFEFLAFSFILTNAL